MFAIILPPADAGPIPSIKVTAETDKVNAQVGDTVTYTFEVTNTGKVTLFGVVVSGTLTGAATKQSESGRRANDKLESWETWVFTDTYTVGGSDPDPLVNTVTATAYTRKGEAYSDIDIQNVYLYGTASDMLPDVLTSPNQEPTGGWYGTSVAIGEGLIVVGAPYESIPIASSSTYESLGDITVAGKPAPAPTNYYGAGRVYVYSATTGALLDTLSSENPVYHGWFGYSVAVGNGVIVVGAPGETSGTYAAAGNAYVYNAASRASLATLTSPNPVSDTGNYQGYGISVAVNDGIIAVGSSVETVSSIAKAGKVYLDAATRTPKAFSPLVTPDPENLGRFGWSVAVGEGVIAVGAPYENIIGTGAYAGRAGRVYTYDTTNGALVDTVTSLNAEASGDFGFSVAVGDGIIVVGALGETVGGNDEAGRAYVYDLTSETITHTLVSQNSQYLSLIHI